MGNENPRDTQFQGFAKLLSDELYPEFRTLDYAVMMSGTIARVEARDREIKQAEENIHDLIARRAYDLVAHILKNADPIDLDISGNYVSISDEDAAQRIANLPDLTEFSDESEASQ